MRAINLPRRGTSPGSPSTRPAPISSETDTTRELDADLALEPLGDGRYAGEIAPGWETLRGPLGGYVMALLARGLEAAVDDPRRTARSITAHFLRTPQAGPITVAARVERTGRSLSTASGRLEQDGELIALALGAFSVPWPGPLIRDAEMPAAAPPEPRDQPTRSLREGPMPAFARRLVFQHRFGAPPASGAERAETGGWLGLRERRPLDAAAICILADAWFPAPWPRLRALAAAPTIDLTVHFRVPLPRPDGLLLGRFRTALVRDGFFEEDGELWSEDGELVAQSRQLGLLLGAEASPPPSGS